MRTVLHTDEVAPEERFDAWADTISRMFVALESEWDDPRRFHGVLKAAQAGQLQLSEVTTGAQVVRRTRALATRHEEDLYKLTLQVSGTGVIAQDGRQCRLRPGDLTLCDTSRPYDMAYPDDFRVLVLMFPRALVPLPPERLAPMTAERLPGNERLGSLVSPFLTRLATQIDDCDSTTAARLADSTLTLITAMLSDRVGERMSTDPSQALLLRIHDYIERNLGHPDLTVDDVAAEHRISRRYLCKLFEQQNTSVARWIRQRRLQRCAQDLLDPALANRGINAVAARWGLLDAPHFSRLFKTTYGVSPRQWRDRTSRPA